MPGKEEMAEIKEKEKDYRRGVDISLYELADRFEQDGYDWRESLKVCGYSDEEIKSAVEDLLEAEEKEAKSKAAEEKRRAAEEAKSNQ